MMNYQAVILGLIWDVFPICTIFVLHKVNFSKITKKPPLINYLSNLKV